MSDYYCDFSTGNDTTGDGTSGTPWKTVNKAIATVTAGDHRILVSDTTADTTALATTVPALGLKFYSTSGISTTYSSRGASLTTAGTVTINGGSWYGFKFGTTTNSFINIGQAVCDVRLYDCEITTGTADRGIVFGSSGGASTWNCEFINVDYVNGGVAGSTIALYSGTIRWIGGTFSGTATTSLLGAVGTRGNFGIDFIGCDLSNITTTLVSVGAPSAPGIVNFVNCKLGSSVTRLSAAAQVNGVNVYLYDCNSGDNHYAFEHYDKYGSTVATTAIYANAGAAYDGTNRISWLVSTTALATLGTPYNSPWIDQYNAGGGAISPNLECVRSGSATAYQDNEVWSAFLAKTTTTSVVTNFSRDRMLPLGTAANQTTGALGASDWTGESGTAWFGKLGGASLTPQEIGYIRARVVVGKASVTDLYVDPKIRLS